MGTALTKEPIIYERKTREKIYEKVPIRLKTALQFLFGTAIGRLIVQTPQFRSYLKRVTLEKGWRYDSEASKSEIFEFIEAYGIDISEIEKPIEEYNTLNEFFYRRLREGARCIAHQEDDRIVVMPCDCRLHVFESLQEARKVWVKGRRFSVKNLTGSMSASEKFCDGSVVICRLAPTDYHRFHSPVTGVVSDGWKWLGKEYYTVKKLAICTPLNVLTENKRLFFVIKTELFGDVGVIIVGAAHVGSIKMTVSPGQRVQKGDELGYFAYGGSTIVLLFEHGTISYDVDLRRNTREGAETLVKMGDTLGRKQHLGKLFDDAATESG